eukprot:4075443-Pleurochrysis_carterae.AAC.2
MAMGARPSTTNQRKAQTRLSAHGQLSACVAALSLALATRTSTVRTARPRAKASASMPSAAVVLALGVGSSSSVDGRSSAHVQSVRKKTMAEWISACDAHAATRCKERSGRCRTAT